MPLSPAQSSWGLHRPQWKPGLALAWNQEPRGAGAGGWHGCCHPEHQLLAASNFCCLSARELQGWSRQCRGPGLQLKGKGDGQGWGPHNPLTSPALGPSAFALHTHTCARACAQTGKHTQFSISPSPQGPSSSPSFLSKPPNSFQNSGFEGQRVSPAAPYTLLLRRWAIPGCDSLSGPQTAHSHSGDVMSHPPPRAPQGSSDVSQVTGRSREDGGGKHVGSF